MKEGWPVDHYTQLLAKLPEKSWLTFYKSTVAKRGEKITTEEEYKHGGYEVDVVSPYTPAAGRSLQNLLQHISREK